MQLHTNNDRHSVAPQRWLHTLITEEEWLLPSLCCWLAKAVGVKVVSEAGA